MDTTPCHSSELEQVIAATLLKARNANNHESQAKGQLDRAMRAAKAKGSLLSKKPSRGCLTEFGHVLRHLHHFLPGLQPNVDGTGYIEFPPQGVVPNGSAYSDTKCAQLWHEAECLVRRPYTFSSLRQLPELQQIVAHTAVAAIPAAAGEGQHIRVLMQAHRDAVDDSSNRSPERAYQYYRNRQLDASVDLLDHLAPSLRLCLAAEVAVGMLCPSHPPPSDTPEHAAALAMFINLAYKHITAELKNDSSSDSRPSPYNTPGRLQQLWSHMQQQQQIEVPKGFLAQDWPLLPHLDLQMHLPADQVLQLLLVLSDPNQQQQQQKQQQQKGVIAGGKGDASTSSTEGCEVTTAAAAAAVEVANEEQCRGGLPSNVGDLTQQHLQGLTALNPGLGSVLDACCFDASRSSLGSAGSGDGGGHAVDQLHMLLQACLRLSGADQQQQQQQQDEESGVKQQSAVQDSAGFAAELFQVIARHSQQHGTSQQQQREEEEEEEEEHPADRHQQQQQQQQQHRAGAATTADSTAAAAAGQCIDWSSVRLETKPGVETLTGFIRTMSTCLLLRFLQRQRCAVTAWQQTVPLQVLLLLGQVQQIVGSIEILDLLDGDLPTPAAAAKERRRQQQQHEQQDRSEHGVIEPDQQCRFQQQQQECLCSRQQQEVASAQPSLCCKQALHLVLQKVLDMIQMMRDFEADNLVLQNTAVAETDPAVAHGDASGACCSSSSSRASAALAPHQFFSAAGPLSAGLMGRVEPPMAVAAGFCGQHVLNTSCSSPAGASSSSSSGANGSSTAGSNVGPQVDNCSGTSAAAVNSTQAGERLEAVQGVAWKILLATGQWELGLQEVQQPLLSALQDSSTVDEVASVCIHKVTEGLKSAEQLDEIQALADSILANPCLQDSSSNLATLQDNAGNLERREQLTCACAGATPAGSVVVDWLTHWKGEYMVQLGLTTRQKWAQYCKHLDTQRVLLDLADLGAGFTVISNKVNDTLDDSSDDELDTAADGTSSNGNGSRSSEMRKDLRQASQGCRRLTKLIAQQLWPLYRYHKSWLQQQRTAAQRSLHYWNSKQRIQAAMRGAAGHDNADKIKFHYVSMGPSSSSSSSSGVGDSDQEPLWPYGQYDCHLRCPLCFEDYEKQRKIAAQQSSSSSSSSDQPPQPSCSSSAPAGPYSTPAVSYSDPFLWRRLLWQLLGKLSPAAQQFYAHYTAMCPHCTDKRLWELIHTSILNALWTPPNGNLVEFQLYHTVPLLSGDREFSNSRLPQIKQYARALNAGFVQGYSPSMCVLAKQVLLSLSPLHHCIAPPAESALYLPSSFTAAAAKALQQQLLARDVLDLFSNSSSSSSGGSSVQLWHVWWHMGIRRYHWLKARSRQQQQQHQMCVDDMYLDPDARLYAVGFAARQLSGAPAGYKLLAPAQQPAAAAGSSSSSDHSSSIAEPAAVATVLHCVAAVQEKIIHTALAASSNSTSDAAAASSSSSSSTAPTGSPVNTAQSVVPSAVRDAIQGSFNEGSDDLKQHVHSILAHPDHILSPAAARQAASRLHNPTHRNIPGATAVIRGYLDSAAAETEAWTVNIISPDGSMQQQQQQQRMIDPSDLKQNDDVSNVLLLPSAAADALVDPAVWWDWQQQLLRLDSICDRCGAGTNTEQQVWCDGCGCALYCSDQCRKIDEPRHAAACGVMDRAAQRYSSTAVRSTPQLDDHSAAAPITSLGWFSRLLAPLPGECGPLSVCCEGIYGDSTGRAVVNKDTIIQEYKKLLAEC